MPIDTFIAYVGVYGSADDAEADYQAVKELHTELGLIDAYDAAVIVHEGGHKVRHRPASGACSAPVSASRRVSSSHCSRSPPSVPPRWWVPGAAPSSARWPGTRRPA